MTCSQHYLACSVKMFNGKCIMCCCHKTLSSGRSGHTAVSYFIFNHSISGIRTAYSFVFAHIALFFV